MFVTIGARHNLVYLGNGNLHIAEENCEHHVGACRMLSESLSGNGCAIVLVLGLVGRSLPN